MRITVNLVGDGFTQEQALAMKAEIVAYADQYNLTGTVIIAEQL